MFEKEIGENPIRARRREAQKGLFLLFAAKRGQAIENSLEKAKKGSATVGIFFKRIPLLRAPTKKEKNKKIF